ncbi:hypothetical protein Tco_1182350 [Tanacetum coccineum]
MMMNDQSAYQKSINSIDRIGGEWWRYGCGDSGEMILESWFFESEGGGGGEGVKEKPTCLANDTVKDTVVVSSAVDEFDSDNTKGTHEGNVGKILSSFSADPNIGTAVWINITDSPTTDVITRVKFHGVPITAFSEDGLSIIATKLGISLMLDSYTSDMCMQSWHTSSYARAMIDLRAERYYRSGYAKTYWNPLVSTGNVDSDSEVEVVFDETVILMASTSFKGGSDRGYGTNSLLEQWRET